MYKYINTSLSSSIFISIYTLQTLGVTLRPPTLQGAFQPPSFPYPHLSSCGMNQPQCKYPGERLQFVLPGERRPGHAVWTARNDCGYEWHGGPYTPVGTLRGAMVTSVSRSWDLTWGLDTWPPCLGEGVWECVCCWGCSPHLLQWTNKRLLATQQDLVRRTPPAQS